MARVMKYEVIIDWSEEDHAFIAEVPELSGCMADGQTKSEALATVEQVAARSGWRRRASSGGPSPKPKGRLAFA